MWGQHKIRNCWAALLGISSVFLAVVAPAGATSRTPEATVAPNGPVLAVARLGNTVYLGGSFTQIGPATGPWAVLSAASGQLDTTMPKVSGNFPPQAASATVAADGAGGWYVGGNFTAVGGLQRNGLAHVRADGSVDPNFNPNVNGIVGHIVVAGSTVYFGGAFTTVNGSVPRHLAAAVDATTGAVTPWDPSPNSDVDALAVSGSTVYMGGAFTKVNGSIARKYAAAFDATTGVVTSWDPHITDGFGVYSLAVSGSTVYMGGDFHTVNSSVARNCAAAVDATTATANGWNPNLSLTVLGSRVLTMIVSGSTVYLGGIFDHVNGGSVARTDLASVDATTGIVSAWNPNPDNNVQTMQLVGSTLYIGGALTKINGSLPRGHLAAVDATSGVATLWSPILDGEAGSIVVSGSKVAVGGVFGSVNPQLRNNLAAIDATTGQLMPWNPNADASVTALAASGSTVYAGGFFTNVNGSTARGHLAALDATTGIATPSWDPEPNSGVNALAISGSTVYAGGSFSKVNSGATTRHNAAAFDSSGTATGWNPNPSDTVNTLAISGSTVYLGGDFTTVNGATPRSHLAAVDAAAGTAAPWNPSTDLRATTLAVAGSTVFVGGDFTTVNGSTARSHAAAFDATSGTATGWNPNLSGSFAPSALTAFGSTVYIGGAFTTVNGSTARAHLASFDMTTGTATSWDPSPDNSVNSLAVAADGTVYAGGNFTTFPTVPQEHFAAFSATDNSPPTIAISAPADGAHYTRGSAVSAAYTCTDSDGPSDVASCQGPVAAGSRIDTSSAGVHTFTVNATDVAGNQASKTVTYTVVGAPAQGVATVLSTSAPLARCKQPFRRLVSHQSGALRITGKLNGTFGIADGRGTIISITIKGTTYTVAAAGHTLGIVTNVNGAIHVIHKSSSAIELRSSDGRVAIEASYNAKHGTRVVAKITVCTFSAARNQIVGVAGGHRPTGHVYLARTSGGPVAGQDVTITDVKHTILLHTGGSGTAAFTLAAGPDRAITIQYAGSASYQGATLTVRIHNHGYGTIHLTTPRLPAHGLAVFAGVAFGRDGKRASLPVTLQYLSSSGRWHTVSTVHSNPSGGWSAHVAWPRHGHAGLTQIYYRIIVDQTPTMQINALLP